jgi:cyclic pyranopterin phosphate synthase
MSMVDVSSKPEVFRESTAEGVIRVKPETVRRVKEGKIEKGDVFTVARVSGILAAKKTSELVPLCHPLPLSNVNVEIKVLDDTHIGVKVTVKAKAQTGVEMEALVAVSATLLAIWDMVKQYEKDEKGQYPFAQIEKIRVIRKTKENREA